jgi:hypothetical protein
MTARPTPGTPLVFPTPSPARLRVVTREIAHVDDLLQYGDPADPLVWT